jgi:hypothetical protein
VRIKDEENKELSDKKEQDGASYTVKSFKICSVHPVFVIKSNRMGHGWEYIPNSSCKTGTVEITRQPNV